MITEVGQDIEIAAEILESNGLVAIPTETVYGLAGNPLSKDAIDSIFSVKGRPKTNPLILHLSKKDKLEKYAKDIPDLAFDLFSEFSPGALTIVLQKTDIVRDEVTAGQSTVAIRIPKGRIITSLLDLLDFPLVAPSANMYTSISPVTAEDVLDELGGKIPYILNGGKCEVGLESTIVSINEGTIKILRHGAITERHLKRFGRVVYNDIGDGEKVPGQNVKHYSPKKALKYFENGSDAMDFIEKEEGIIRKYGQLVYEKPPAQHSMLTRTIKRELSESSYLYSDIRELDSDPEIEILLAILPNDDGVGRAIRDKLIRASS
ncbi:MAG: L-threonylcarbamoyladenylate synthase [Candidatus Kapaibacteriales bacterium]